MTAGQWHTIGFCAGWTALYCLGLLVWEFWAWHHWGPSARITDTVRTLRDEYGWVPALVGSVAMMLLGGLLVHFASGKPEKDQER